MDINAFIGREPKMTAELICHGLSKHLGGRPVLQALDLDVKAGEVVSLLGASGSGKTTLLRCIAGLVNPDAGMITLDGKAVFGETRNIPAEKRRIGMVFQDYALWPHMTVDGNLSFALQSQNLTKDEIRSRVEHALELARLAPLRERHPAELSGGQQQRVAIARCIAARPSLILFDEPLSNLDAALREDMRTEMMDLVRHEGLTVVYVTHDQSEAMAVSDRIAVMRNGILAQFASPQELYERPANAFVAGFIGGFSVLPLTDFASGDGYLVIRPEDARPKEFHADMTLSGRIVARAFQGRCWRLTLEIGRTRVKIDWPSDVSVGYSLSFSLPPDRRLFILN
jgi:ABC-type Fe3+/spermidine/putrescine transport system ATPase subunit